MPEKKPLQGLVRFPLVCLRGASSEEVLLIYMGGHSYIEKAHHHFVVSLISPRDRTVGIGIVSIVRGIVIPGNSLQFGSSLQQARLCQTITQLPIEIVVHAQQRFRLVIGPDQVVLESLPAQMHVREK